MVAVSRFWRRQNLFVDLLIVEGHTSCTRSALAFAAVVDQLDDGQMADAVIVFVQ